MTTLTELKGQVWYRFLKVIYILFYILSFLSVIGIIHKSSYEHHDPILPNTVDEVLKDPEFYKLDDYEMRKVLSSIDDKIYLNVFDQFDEPKKEEMLFKDFSNIEQEWYISGIHEQPIPNTPLPKKYIYKSYKLNITKFISHTLIFIVCFVLIMECTRRCFYYIVIGKVFPKE